MVVPVWQVDDSWVSARVAELDIGWAWVLLQEPRAISFGVATKRCVTWPPGVVVDWGRLQDLRIFSAHTEWHVWATSNEAAWLCRRLDSSAPGATITESHLLWGTRAEPAGEWTICREDRGAEVWIPAQLVTAELPAALTVHQVIGYHEQSGVAGVVDARLSAIVGARGRPLSPSSRLIEVPA